MSTTLSTLGEVVAIGEVGTFGKRNFQKRDLIIELTEGNYPQLVPFEFGGDRNIMLVDRVDVGDIVEISFELRGRAWTDPKTNTTKYFGSLAGTSLEVITKSTRPKVDPGAAADIPF